MPPAASPRTLVTPVDPMRERPFHSSAPALALLAFLAGGPDPAFAQPGPGTGRGGDAIEARIWLDRGLDPVFQRGDRARVYYRASRDAFVALFHLDTDGVLRLLYPDVLAEPAPVRGGQDYRLLFREDSDWEVEEDPGVGYFFALASAVPFDFGADDPAAPPAEWARLAATGAPVREDPFVLLDEVARDLVPEAARGGLAVDFTAYHVGQTYSFPRFLCYTCHAAESFEVWNPYQQACVDYRVVIFNDPYFYPASRYQGSRPVHPRPPTPGAPQFAFRARDPGESGAPLVMARSQGAAAGAATAVGSFPAGAAVRTVLPAPSGPAGATPVQGGPETTRTRPTLQRRSTVEGTDDPRR